MTGSVKTDTYDHKQKLQPSQIAVKSYFFQATQVFFLKKGKIFINLKSQKAIRWHDSVNCLKDVVCLNRVNIFKEHK